MQILNGPDIMNRHNVRMVHDRGMLPLISKAVEVLGVFLEERRGKNLQRTRTCQFSVPGEEDSSHSSAPEDRFNVIMIEFRPQ